MIWSGALMLEFLGQGDERFTAAHDEIITAIEQAIASGEVTPDLGGQRSTQEVGAAIAARVGEAR